MSSNRTWRCRGPRYSTIKKTGLALREMAVALTKPWVWWRERSLWYKEESGGGSRHGRDGRGTLGRLVGWCEHRQLVGMGVVGRVWSQGRWRRGGVASRLRICGGRGRIRVRPCWLWLIATGAFAFESLNLANAFVFVFAACSLRRRWDGSLQRRGRITQCRALLRSKSLRLCLPRAFHQQAWRCVCLGCILIDTILVDFYTFGVIYLVNAIWSE